MINLSPSDLFFYPLCPPEFVSLEFDLERVPQSTSLTNYAKPTQTPKEHTSVLVRAFLPWALLKLYSLIDGFEIIGCILLDCHADLRARADDGVSESKQKKKG